ncbi:MAG: UbiA family prenyltransferase [Bacteroidota bacterium]|nr:UbiA family prenyltransferase [Bacteroidota bacterium]MDP4246395.1 UbiA family prenyltransferase [Bacteroidota bacterium]MDP4259253.1 UbiA family prenyltransferase [Bacteroidota bacterium]
MFRKIFDLFIFSSLYIALCAVLMVDQTSRLLIGVPSPLDLNGFVFFSTICSYNFHWYLTPHSVTASRRVEWTQGHKALHMVLYLAGAIGAIVCFVQLRAFWPALCFGAFLTFLYSAPKLPQTWFSALKKIAIGKTVFLTLVWTYVTTVLPLVVARASWTAPCTLFVLSRFTLIYAICILFDYRDREDDKEEGIRSLITYLNERGIDITFYVCLAAFAGCTIALIRYDHPAFLILLLLVPGMIVGGIYRHAKTNFSDYLYYFVLDGLMMFSGLLMLVFRI